MGSHNCNCKALRNRYKCPHCEKGFMNEWARLNCQKRCNELTEAIDKHPERYKGIWKNCY